MAGRRRPQPRPEPGPPVAPVAASDPRRFGWWLVAVVGLAVGLRVAHVLALRSTPWFLHLVVDPEFYDAWAQRIAAGDWLGERPFYMDPLYPYVLAAVYRVAGRDLLLVRLLQVGLSAVACVCVAVLGRRVGGRAVGLVAALGFALYLPEIFYVGEIDKTCLSICLTALALAFGSGRSPGARLGAGIALGLAILTRANLILMAPLAAAVVLLDREERHARVGGVPRAAVGAVLLVLGVVAVLAPVAWRNHRVGGEWVLTTAQAGQNFYTGNNPTNPYGAYGEVPFVRPNPHFEEEDFRRVAEQRAGRALTASEVSRFWFGETVQHMRAQPAFALRAMARKLALFWNDFEISDNQDQYLLARDSWVLALPLLGFGGLAALAALGAVVGVRARRPVRLLVAGVGVYCVSVVAFFIFSRYRIHVVPALLPLAGVGVVELAQRVRARAWARVAAATAVVVGAGLLTFQTIGLFSADHELVVDLRLRHLGDVHFAAGNHDRAIAVFQEAVTRCPQRCPLALRDLLVAYLQSGKLADGEAYFRGFTRAHPQVADGWRYLARVLVAAGKPEEAAEAEAHAGAG